MILLACCISLVVSLSCIIIWLTHLHFQLLHPTTLFSSIHFGDVSLYTWVPSFFNLALVKHTIREHATMSFTSRSTVHKYKFDCWHSIAPAKRIFLTINNCLLRFFLFVSFLVYKTILQY